MKQNSDKKIIALTGGIGSGKSEALKILKGAGFAVFSCDDFTLKAYKKHRVIKGLKENFNDAIKGKIFKTVDKKKLSELAFNNDDSYKKLCDTVTPTVFDLTMKKAKRVKGNVVVEVPLLFEYSSENEFDGVIVIKRDLRKRIESVKVRSNLKEEEIIKRIERQVDYDSIDLTKYFVVENNGSKKDLEKNLLKAVLDMI